MKLLKMKRQYFNSAVHDQYYFIRPDLVAYIETLESGVGRTAKIVYMNGSAFEVEGTPEAAAKEIEKYAP
ncbi:hypothetical protein LNV08_13250 [Paucibacter sp. TC2R-5]|uniref:hypothetical protein n=1 Tax=Paucibacter sp. TC2R-5 TaxID=2893555 RepID=UPI0021E365AB|nr:hypothetical protein [Paucibacter sp. TC2R-5]MCV2359938.1 hypothetical protein [Paucibacter sp. TC2R-5]